MPKKIGVLLILFLLDSNRLTAQTIPQNTDKLYLTCSIELFGRTYKKFVTVIFNPPQVSMDNDPLTKAIINDIEIIWAYGRISRLTGLYSDGSASGPCEKAPIQQKF